MEEEEPVFFEHDSEDLEIGEVGEWVVVICLVVAGLRLGEDNIRGYAGLRGFEIVVLAGVGRVRGATGDT